jgi:PAS domain S-box-containing protein
MSETGQGSSMLDFFSKLFDTTDFPERWRCGNWTADLGWLHILSDLGIWSAYLAIPIVLAYFLLRRKDIPFRTIFLLFGAFILACGTTHLMDATTFWWPAYRLAGVIKLFTALVSWATVIALMPVVPKALAMRGPEELKREVAVRKEAEIALQKANTELERQVDTLRAAELRFRLLVEGTKDYAIFMLDPTGRIASWNPGAERIKQYRAEEIVGQHFSRFYPPEDIKSGKPDRELEVAQAEGRYEEEGWRLRKDGTRFWANVLITALRGEDGSLQGFSKITRDMTERKQAEESARRLLQEEAARRAAEEQAEVIREQRELLRVTLHSIGDGVITTNMEGKVTFLNPVAEALTGWSHEDTAYGMPLSAVFNIVHEQSRQPAENPADLALRHGRIVGLANHTVLIARDGTERPIEDSAAPIRQRNGSAAGVVLVFRDATERRRAEQAERKNKEVLELVHKIGKIGYWEWNSQTDENKWSPELERLYGLPPGGFEGGYQGWAKLLHPEDLPRAEADVRRAMETGEYFTEFRVMWPDGSVHWLETRASVFKDGRDRSVRIMGVNMDVTERKRQEGALRVSEQRWRSLTEELPNLVWTTLPDGQCDWLSSQWRNYTGIPENHLLGMRWLETVVHPDDRQRTLRCWQAACVDQEDYDLEYRIRRHDGEYHWFKTRGVPIRDRQGLIVYWLGTCTDVEDAKRLEAALRAADERKNEFLATLAHELRNPLAPIRNGLQVLRLTDERSARQQAREMMERQLEQLVRLVDDLLDISRISCSKIELRKSRIPLASVVENAVETARPLIDLKGHTLKITLPIQPLYLDADLTRLAQVFWNLLNNSAKYTDPGGRIDLSAACEGNEVVVTVRDTGIGIPAEALPALFNLFSQVDPSLERSQGGLGIGLALVKGLVGMHGGSVQAHSAGVGLGSEFVVRLPLASARVEDTQAPTTETTLPPARRRVLIVDDYRDGAASLGMMLSLVGHDIRTAHDGLQALELAEAFRPEVILLDIGLPKLNGYDTCRRLREQPWGKGMVIIALTGWGQEDDRRRSEQAGFDQHMVKPVDITALEILLAELPDASTK